MLWTRTRNRGETVTLRWLLSILVALSLAGMACSHEIRMIDPPDPTPDWALRGSGRFAEAGVLAFWGVGSAPRMANKAMQADLAANRARRQALEVLNAHLALALRSGHCLTTPGELTPPGCDLLQYKGLTREEDLVVAARWTDPRDGTAMARVRLDLQAVERRLAALPGLPEPLRRQLTRNLHVPAEPTTP